MSELKVIVGITTYNRLNILEKMAKSFYASNLSNEYEIVIFDDASTEFGIETLECLFPNAKLISRNKENVGADYNTYLMYKYFIDNYDENCILFNADSDLIFCKEWLTQALYYFKKTEGILSIFNAKNHVSISDFCDGICEKNIMGAAGTIFSYAVLNKLFDKNSEYALTEELVKENGVDCSYCYLLKKTGIRLLCVVNSLVQHVGLYGYNCVIDNFDYGCNFNVDSNLCGQLINDTIEEMCKAKHSATFLQLFPYRDITVGSKIIIYGAGKVGADYYDQVEMTNYCEIVAVADRRFSGNKKGRINPSQIREYEYDYIVVATIKADLSRSIINDLIEMGLYDEKKVICPTRNIIEITKLKYEVCE